MTSHRWSTCYTTPPGDRDTAYGEGSHQWGLASAGKMAMWDSAGRWAAAGDFCSGPGLERAAASGVEAAEAVAEMLGLPPCAE